MLRMFGTHPSTEARIARLRVMALASTVCGELLVHPLGRRRRSSCPLKSRPRVASQIATPARCLYVRSGAMA